jgi:two-component system OmpR family response regulator
MLIRVESSRIPATGCSSGHVLVVDDDPAVRHLISDHFGQHGIQTVSAMGRSAVARQLAGGDTSAIILDLHLVQDNGLDLLREIRSSSDVPVIILTARCRDEVDCVVGHGPRAPATSSGADTSSADGGLTVAAGASSIRRNGR